MALYNEVLYNEEQFNAFFLMEQIILTDATLAIFFDLALSDTIFPSELFTKQVTNKGLADNINTADWVSSKRVPTNTEWFD